jgi:hypothetical protein
VDVLVHGELIKAGKVVPLTYKQLRRLEKMDRDKERDRLYGELAKQTIASAGQAAEGAFAGLGLVGQGYLSGDALAFAAKSVAGALFLAWLITNYPNFAKFLHLDVFPSQGPGIAINPPPGSPPGLPHTGQIVSGRAPPNAGIGTIVPVIITGGTTPTDVTITSITSDGLGGLKAIGTTALGDDVIFPLPIPVPVPPTGVNLYSLPGSVLQDAANKASSGNTLGCLAELAAHNVDTATAVNYCSNFAIGAGQA